MIAYDTPSGFIITNFPLNQNSKFTRLSFPPLLHRAFPSSADPVSFCGSFSISRENGYIKVDGVSSVFCFIWGWEEPAWGLPFQFHGVFFVMIRMKGP